MGKLITTLVVAAFLTSPALAEGLSQQEIDMVKQAVVDGLKDPDSARFGSRFWEARGIERGPGDKAYCGYVNARNSYGGFTGEQLFLVQLGSLQHIFTDGLENLQRNWCGRLPR